VSDIAQANTTEGLMNKYFFVQHAPARIRGSSELRAFSPGFKQNNERNKSAAEAFESGAHEDFIL
jgi:hypothetical protein